MRYFITNMAEIDMGEISDYISLDNPFAALKWHDNMVSQFELIAEFPHIGVAKSKRRPDLRSFPVKNYMVLYQIKSKTVEIVRILHGARDWKRLF